jgi:hypothetical protein
MNFSLDISIEAGCKEPIVKLWANCGDGGN